jgi:molybdenum cofactor cytidylyltransferase
MKNIQAISAVILSAGFSERMGCFKPLMALGSQKVVERVVSQYRSAGVSDICVVVGHRAAEMTAALAGSGVRIVYNGDFESGMYASVLEGIRGLPASCRAFFIHPVDIPLVRAATVSALLRSFHDATSKIFYPLCSGRRGHPPLIAADLTQEILAWSETGGLRALLEKHETLAVDVPVMDEGILFDLDTPEDLQYLLSRLKNEHIPTPVECRMLMQRICNVPGQIVNHCRAVAKTAAIIASAVNRTGLDVDADLVYTAALVHDVGRGEKSHAEAGADLLEKWGFPEPAAIVRTHMDMAVDDTRPISEAEILYLADKLVAGDRRVDLVHRFREKMKRYEKNPQAVAAVQCRLKTALKIKAKLERATGRCINEILNDTGRVG